MAKKTKFKGVYQFTPASIGIRFRYQGKVYEERFKAEPCRANFQKLYALKVDVDAAIVDGSFDYAATFPNSKRARRFQNNRLVYTYLKQWVMRQAHLKDGVSDKYKVIIEGQIKGTAIARMRLIDLKWADIRDWALSKDVAHKTRLNYMGVLSSGLTDALEEEIIDAHPMAGRKLKAQKVYVDPEADDEDIKPLSWDERDAVIAVSDPRFGLMVDFCCWAGLRLSELVALRWDRVNFKRRTIRIDQVITDKSKAPEVPKTKRSRRTVELNEPAFEALVAYKEYSFLMGERIFLNPADNKPWETPRHIYRHWVRRLRKAGVDHRGADQMRHTYASTGLSEGENIGYISKQMGHANVAVTIKHYARFIPDNQADRGSKMVDAWRAHKAKTDTKK